MVKSPKTRHSKSRRNPVTIELDAKDVSRTKADDEAKAAVEHTDAEQSTIGKQAEPQKASSADKPTPKAGTPTEKASTGASAGTGASAATASPPASRGSSAAQAASSAKSGSGPKAPATAASTSKSETASSSKPADKSPHGKSSASASTSASPGASTSQAAPRFGRDDGASKKAGAAAPGGRAPNGKTPRRGSVNALLGGIVGGLVVLLLGGVLYFAGVISGIDRGDGQAVGDLRAEIENLKSGLAETRQLAENGGGGDELRQTVETAQGRIEDISAALDEVRSQIASVQSAVESGGAGDAPGLAAVGERLTTLETQVSDLANSSDTAGGDVAADIARLEESVRAAGEQAKAAADAAKAASGVSDDHEMRLHFLEQTVTGIAKKLDNQAAEPNVALAIAASALKAAIDRGTPFTSELETYASLSPDAEAVSALRDMAADGVPTRAAIAARADAAATAMIDAARGQDDEAGFFGRLFASAQSVVKVRPVGMVEGDTVPAIVARMEAAINDGDYARATTEYDTLPEAPKAAGQDFIADVKARQAADDLVGTALADALKT